MNSTKLSAFCDKVMELGWLLAVIVTPLFFNVNSSNVFERDKWTTLRTIALVMAAFWLVRLVEEWISNGKPDLRITWRTPLALPIFLMILSYVISAIFSVTPYISIFGGYQRLRGVFSALSCIVICLIVLDRLQTREQAERFITVMILNSLPIALYGFIQHAGLDPLPWGGDVTQRIASSMGNAIFVAAYMIMAAIPTLARVVEAFQAILADEDTGAADVLRAAAYIFLLLVQIISIFYSQSRGPLLGLVAGVGVWALLGLLALQRGAQRERPFQSLDLLPDLGRGLLFGITSVAAAGVGGVVFYFIGKGIDALWAGRLPEAPMWAGVIGAVLAFLFMWGAFIINRRGWRWLWAGALLISILFGVFFMLINLVDPIHDWSRQLPFLGRLDDVLYGSGGTTGKVRAYIWEGALEMILPHDPIEFPPTAENPEWRPDAFNFLRPIVGYGPESMYVAYNRFYPPMLGHVESRTATPDRSHNETLDTLVITGLLGLAAYLWTFGGIFYYALRWLGFMPKDWRRILFFVLLVGGAVGAVILSGILLGFHFFGLAIPVGMVGGFFIYLIVYGFSLYWEPEAVPEPHPHYGLLTGILAAVVAYFIEVNFGIAIASTRTILWTLTGMLVVIGMGQIHDRLIESQERRVEIARQAGSKRRKRRKRRQVVTRSSPDWMGSILALGVVGGFILGTLAFDFVSTNPEGLPNAWKIVWRALTIRPFHDRAFSPGVLIVFVFTWLMSAVVFVAQMAKQGAFRKREWDWARAAGVYLSASLVVGMGFALVMASRHVSLLYFQARLQERLQDQTQPLSTQEYLAAVVFYVDKISNHITTYYAFIVFALIAGAWALYQGMRQQLQVAARRWGVVALVVLALLAGFLSVMVNLRPIRADMVYKAGLSYEKESPIEALELFKHAIELAPNEDFYYFELGRVYLLNVGSDPGNAVAAIEAFIKAQSIAPLNTDHVKGLAKSYHVWSKVAAASGDVAAYQERLQRADEYYEIATSLSPHNAFLQNERVRFYFEEGNLARAEEAIAVSLEIDSEYYDTWMLLGDLHCTREEWAEAAGAYERALEVDPNHADTWSLLGGIYIEKLNRPADAARAFIGMGGMHVDRGSLPEAIQAYNQALSLDPGLNDAWEFHYKLAEAYDRLGQSELAIFHARDALRLAPEEEQADLQVWLAELQALEGVRP
ncbi:MAG: tetratricopeptide repeat protein [Anaerolineae bacterium]|nr:tetratricopeptide repeat protein [Anaerolineae bacterium]